MPNGRPTRRATPRLAPGFVILCLTLAAGAGCQHFPLRRPEVAPAPSEPSPPRELPALPSTPLVSDSRRSEVTGPTTTRGAAETASAPTPLLDAAIAHARAVPSEPVFAPDPAPLALPDMAEKAEAKTTDVPRTSAAEPKASETPEAPAAAPAPPPKSSEPEKSPEPVVRRDDWGDSLGRLRELARRRAGEPGEVAEAWAIRSRVLDWLAGDGQGPVGESDRAWNRVLAALSSATSAETPDEPALAHHLSAAVASLEAFAPLQINALTLCRKVQGFGNYQPLGRQAIRAGQQLLLYCEMEGLKYEEGEGAFRTRLSSRVEVVPAGGGEAVWSLEFGADEDLCRRRRRDYYVDYLFVLPGGSTLTPGQYGLRLTQTDLVSGRSVASSVAFQVSP